MQGQVYFCVIVVFVYLQATSTRVAVCLCDVQTGWLSKQAYLCFFFFEVDMLTELFVVLFEHHLAGMVALVYGCSSYSF